MQAKERLLSRNGKMRDDILSLCGKISITEDLHKNKRVIVSSEKGEGRSEK